MPALVPMIQLAAMEAAGASAAVGSSATGSAWHVVGIIALVAAAGIVTALAITWNEKLEAEADQIDDADAEETMKAQRIAEEAFRDL